MVWECAVNSREDGEEGGGWLLGSRVNSPCVDGELFTRALPPYDWPVRFD